MIGLDTNILLRAALQDDAAQALLARRVVSRLDVDDPGYVNTVVLVELAWTLGTRFKYTRAEILAFIEAILESGAYTIADRDAVNAAVTRSRDDSMDFADALIGELNRLAGCRTTLTFDDGACRSSAFKKLA